MPTDKPIKQEIPPSRRGVTDVVKALNKIDTSPANVKKNRDSISDNNGGRIQLEREKRLKYPK